MILGGQRDRTGHDAETLAVQIDQGMDVLDTVRDDQAELAAGMVIVSSGGILEILDTAGKVHKRFQVDHIYSLGENIEALPDGRLVLPHYSINLVAEYNAEGEIVWKAPVATPTSVARLPNGNTLVVSLGQQRVVELARDGSEVWSCPTDGRPWRARRR